MSDAPYGTKVFRIPKSTGTHGDVFAAVGLADLLASIPDLGNVTLREAGTEFEVHCPREMGPADLDRIPVNPGYPFLKANEKVTVPGRVVDVVDYKVEKAKADRMREAARASGRRRRGGADPIARELLQQDLPREDWRLLQVLNTMQGDETSNRVHATIVARAADRFRREVGSALGAVSHRAQSALDWQAKAVQLFTPTAAKGFGRLKPDSTDRNDQTKAQWVDPFVEWLKYRGYFLAACPFFRGDDIRLLCPVPKDISAGALRSVARELRRSPGFGRDAGPAKIDSLTALKIAELLIRRSAEYHDAGAEVLPGLFLTGKSPADAVSGVTVTHYQSLGNARAVSSMATIALPGWFRIEDRQDAADWLEILDEHERVVRGLRDDHSDEIGLLIGYRRFLEVRGDSAAWRLVEFMERYGPFLIRAREQHRKVRAFTSASFRRIVMGMAPGLSNILEDPGFQAVAAAVRKSTVSAQAQKAMRKPDYREIRYDLLHELRRKRSLPGPAPLVEAVADFVSKYNSENARRREMGRRAPKNVTTDEFAAFTALVETHGASVVGALLGAYGSCREPRDPEGAEPPDLDAGSDERTSDES